MREQQGRETGFAGRRTAFFSGMRAATGSPSENWVLMNMPIFMVASAAAWAFVVTPPSLPRPPVWRKREAMADAGMAFIRPLP